MALSELSILKKGIIGFTALTATAVLLPLPLEGDHNTSLQKNTITPPKAPSLCFDEKKPHFTYREPNAKTGSITIEFDGNMEDASKGRLTADIDLKRLAEHDYPLVDTPDFRDSKLGFYFEAFYNKYILPMLSIRLMVGKTTEDQPRDTLETDIPLLYKTNSANQLIACWSEFGNLEAFITYPKNNSR